MGKTLVEYLHRLLVLCGLLQDLSLMNCTFKGFWVTLAVANYDTQQMGSFCPELRD